MKAAKCHPSKSLYCRGLCSTCYKRHGLWEKNNKAVTCRHPSSKHHALGLCQICYQRLQRDRRGARPDYARRALNRPFLRGRLPEIEERRVQRLLDDLGKVYEPAKETCRCDVFSDCRHVVRKADATLHLKTEVRTNWSV